MYYFQKYYFVKSDYVNKAVHTVCILAHTCKLLISNLLDTSTYTDRSSTSWPSAGQNAERPAGSWSSQTQTNRKFLNIRCSNLNA